MQATELIKYINSPQLLNEKSVEDLKKITTEFPYFQAAHILLSVASRRWDDSTYQQSLRKTAIVVSNRSHLFDLINKQEEPQSSESTIVLTPKAEPEQEVITKTEQPVQSAEETKQELDILKATELSAAGQKEELAESPKADRVEEVEKEMGKQLISAFIEKEVLKTPELHNPIKKHEPPVSFSDWLTHIRNTSQTPTSILAGNSDSEKKTEETGLKAKESDGANNGHPPRVNTQEQSRKLKNRAIIDRIIESSPGLIRVKEEQKFYTPDNKAKESLQENEHLVTETLAKIYALQGNVNKAVRAYEILSLKFPQKSAYFASLIQKLKNNK